MIYASLCWSLAGPFAAAAEELGVSPAFVSKRVSLLEQTLNVVLLHRTTRRVTITEEGERIYEWAQRILQDVDEMMDELSDVRQVPQGTLRIISSFGFGRRVVAPALSAALALQYPQLELRFDVRDRLVDLVNEGVDLDIRVGDDIAPNLIARQLAANHRVLCASPQFLARHPPPKQLSDLAALPCLVIKERDHPFGIWQLHSKEGQHAIKVTGPLSSNHGEIVHQWCLDGQGIALRSWWDVRENIASGHLVHVLPEFFQPANVWAVYVSRLATSAKIRTTVEFLRHYFQQHYPQHEPTASAVGRGD